MKCKNCGYGIIKMLQLREYPTSTSIDGMYVSVWIHYDSYGKYPTCNSPYPNETEYINLILEKYEMPKMQGLD